MSNISPTATQCVSFAFVFLLKMEVWVVKVT